MSNEINIQNFKHLSLNDRELIRLYLVQERKEAQKGRLSFEELKEKLLKYNCKSEYQQTAIVILRDIFNDTFK
ncbi:MAG: hypothetical protein OEV44_00815 [Spirochaetota bacterium]|nr:hypothetical protein [Spirochaetota bacterium]